MAKEKAITEKEKKRDMAHEAKDTKDNPKDSGKEVEKGKAEITKEAKVTEKARANATTVTNQDTLPETVQPQKEKESNFKDGVTTAISKDTWLEIALREKVASIPQNNRSQKED